jgi:hypothetical protein
MIDWRHAKRMTNKAWDLQRCLYAYFHQTDNHPVIYLGKTSVSAYNRYAARDKDLMFDAFKTANINPRIFIGEILLEGNRRLTGELLTDVESLMIHRLQPWWNTQNRKSRGSYSRPGMKVHMIGDWPHHPTSFHDR